MGIKTFFTRLFGDNLNTAFTRSEEVDHIDRIQPSEIWLDEYGEKKEFLKGKINYWDQYEKVKNNNFENSSGDIIELVGHGRINLNEEDVLVCDPIAGISWDLPAYFKKVSPGDYPIETLLIKSPRGECFNSSTRVRFSKERPTDYIQALKGNEDLESIKSEKLFGFSSVSGFVGIMDTRTKKEYLEEISNFQDQNPDLNWYDDMFIHKIEEAKENYPDYNSKGINFTNYDLENKEYSIPLIALPFKNMGSYPVFFGINENGDVLELLVHYMEVDI